MIKKSRLEEIEAIVDRIIKDNDLLHPAFDFIKFLNDKEKIDVKLRYSKKTSNSGIMTDAEADEQKVKGLIYIRTSTAELKSEMPNIRYLAACEYAHYVLYNTKGLYTHLSTLARCTREDREAAYFVRCLLMPKTLVQELLSDKLKAKRLTRAEYQLIAAIFNVPEGIARRRMRELKQTTGGIYAH